MALQYSTITVEPAPGYGVHNPGPASTVGFEAMQGGKVFAPQSQVDYHLDVAAQSPAIVSVSAVTHRTDFFPKGSIVTVIQFADKPTLTEETSSQIKESGARNASEISHMVAILKPNEACKGCNPYEKCFEEAKASFFKQNENTLDTKPLGVLAEAVRIEKFRPTVIPVAVMGAIEAVCNQEVQSWYDMYPGERVLVTLTGVVRSVKNEKLELSDNVLGNLPDQRTKASSDTLLGINPTDQEGWRHGGFYARGILARVLTPPERNTGLVYLYLE